MFIENMSNTNVCLKPFSENELKFKYNLKISEFKKVKNVHQEKTKGYRILSNCGRSLRCRPR